MTIRWPIGVLRPQSVSFDIASRSLSGPASVSGAVQVVSSDAGIWKAELGSVVINNRQTVLAWRGISGLLEGRLGSILVPLCRGYQPNVDGWQELIEPVPHSDDAFFSDGSGYVGSVNDVTLAGSVAARATTANVSIAYGGELEPGQHFSIGERLYRIRTAVETRARVEAGVVSEAGDFTDGSYDAAKVSVSRISVASYFGADGGLYEAAAYTARIQHDPATGAALGLMSEPPRRNFLTNTFGMMVANGALQAGVEDSSGDGYFSYFSSGIRFPTPASTIYYYKQHTFTSFTGVFSFFVVMEDLSEPRPGSVVSPSADFGIIIDGLVITTGITKINLGSGRWRIVVAVNEPAYTNGYFGIQARTTTSTKPFRVYGFQLESASTPSSYIKTTSSTADRTAETITLSGEFSNTWTLTYDDDTTSSFGPVDGDLTVSYNDTGGKIITTYEAILDEAVPATATITFRPPLREAASLGDRLEFDDPVVRMRLASDSEMDLPLDGRRWAMPTVSFVEDV